MRITSLVLALSLAGMAGTMQAASRHTHRSTRPARSASQTQIHKVRKGETPATIARENGLSVAELAALNPKIKFTRLKVGTPLKVGTAKAAKPARSLKVLDRVAEAPAGSRPALQSAAQPAAPLPATPLLGPTSLVHLERVLPAEVHLDAPSRRDAPVREALASTPSPALADLRTVLPANASDDPVPAVLSAPTGFEPADPSHLDLLWPVETRTVSSAWGPRMRSRTVKVKARKTRKRVKVRYRGSHKGVDLTAPMGTNVFAAMDGKVIASGRHRQYGNFVVLDHGNGVITLYAHHNRNFVGEGEVVRRGQKIAEVGRTGNATGPHLHFELRLKGLPTNPLPMLNDVEEIPAEWVTRNETAAPSTPSR